jgi:hypothetical protein
MRAIDPIVPVKKIGFSVMSEGRFCGKKKNPPFRSREGMMIDDAIIGREEGD